MRRRRRTVLLVLAAAVAAALVLVGSGAAGPGPHKLGNLFFGPKLVRAEVVLSDRGGLHDYRIDRGRIRAVAPDSLTLLERDGSVVTVPVAGDASVKLGGKPVRLVQLRRGLVATTIREGDRPAQTVEVARR